MYIVSNSVVVCVSSKLPRCRPRVTNILNFRSGAAVILAKSIPRPLFQGAQIRAMDVARLL